MLYLFLFFNKHMDFSKSKNMYALNLFICLCLQKMFPMTSLHSLKILTTYIAFSNIFCC